MAGRRSTIRSSSQGRRREPRRFREIRHRARGAQGRGEARHQSADALKKTLLAAKSIGYSTGPSGVYMHQLADLWKPTSVSPLAIRVPTNTPDGSA